MRVISAAAAVAVVASVAAVPIESELLRHAKAVVKRSRMVPANHLTKRDGSSPNITDTDILNFALQLEYLEAQFYHIAAYGTQLSQDELNGTGTRGYISNNAGNQVPFNSSLVQGYAIEIATDEENHVKALRAALGADAVAMPEINLDTSFTAAAQAAGIIGSNETFSPFASDADFLLGAFLFEDVGVTAYNGAAPLISSKAYLAAAASILAVEAYHASAIRVNLLAAGQTVPADITAANEAATAETSLGGPGNNNITTSSGSPQVVNADANSLAYARTPGAVLNIAYLTTTAGATSGGFFPNGLNGNINAAAGPVSSS